jgi:PhnB protein
MPEVNPIPEGYPRVTPYLHVDGAATAIDFYKEILGAEERMRMRMPAPEGKLGHAELQIGESIVMLADEFPDMEARGPNSIGDTPVTLHVYVEDVETGFDAALAAGATSLRAVENQFYGDRTAQFEDPSGHRWNIATHVEDVAPEEMEKRMAEAMPG